MSGTYVQTPSGRLALEPKTESLNPKEAGKIENYRKLEKAHKKLVDAHTALQGVKDTLDESVAEKGKLIVDLEAKVEAFEAEGGNTAVEPEVEDDENANAEGGGAPAE